MIHGIIHIGAHYGQEYPAYRNAGIRNIILIEPIPRHFQRMQESISCPDVLMFQTALGAEKMAEVKMYLSTFAPAVNDWGEGMSSSILRPKKHLKIHPEIRFRETIKVKMTTLDDLVREENIDLDKFNMIVIDVQGYELEVFKGATNTLGHIDRIYSEVNRDEVYENCPHVKEIDSYLSQFGFERKKTKWIGGMWGDALYKKLDRQ